MTTMQSLAKGSSAVSGVSPEQQRSIRTKIYRCVAKQLDHADRILAGELPWSTAQNSMFKTLLNKCLPDAAPDKDGGDASTKTLGELSPGEFQSLLDRVATGSKKVSGG